MLAVKTCIDTITLEYEIAGTGEHAIFIHGALIADAFRPLLDEPVLTDRYRLINYHRQGYAGSSRPSGTTTIAAEASDCRSLLGHLGIDCAHVVGHSFGGAVALQMALDAPDLVHSLALLEPALMVGESGPGYRDSLLRGIERYREAGVDQVVNAFMEARWPGYRPHLERLLPEALGQAVADAGTAFERELPGLLQWQFGEDEAARIRQPVLSVLGGGSDALSPRFPETHQWLLARMPNAQGAVLEDATHLMQLEHPTGVAEILSDFWFRHPFDASQVG
jgi:pimeloyl-ACP methyl ester carboxylesterase